MQFEYYTILGISREATSDEIKKAYKKRAMELHPDRHGGSKEKEEEFKKLNEAYSVLSDEQKKAHYDRYGSMDGYGNMGGFGGFQGGFDAGDLGDIFSSFFGGGFRTGGRRGREHIGEDIEIRISISLEDAIRGNTRKIEYKRRIHCETCHGKGGKTKKCGQCNGSGQVRERTRTVFGVIEQLRICSQCDGIGEIIHEKCTTCHGKKYTEILVKKDIEIPLGIEDGMSIKMRDEGHMGTDGNGDLYITFSVPSREGGLERDGHTLHYTVRISPALAVLGGKKEIEIPIIGKKILEIKRGTQGGDSIKFPNEGLVRLNSRGSKGDLIIHYDIDIPTKISHKEMELYQSLLDLQGEKNTPKGFFGGIFE